MIETIAHIADIHFRNIQRHNEFRAICENFFDQMKKVKPERLVIAGDIVHSRNQISPELVSEVSWFLSGCSKVAGKVIIIPGNHDIVEQNKERMDALTPIINALDADNIVYYTKSGLYQDENVVWSVFSIFDNHMSPEQLEMRPFGGLYVGLYHGTIVGAVNEQGFKFTHGADTNKFRHCDMVLCGDIHKRQVFMVDETKPVIMVGSFIQQNFGETVSQHGYNIVKINNDKLLSYEFHDIENPVKYLTFKITDISDIEENNELLVNA
jgi:DNA repair exonuclease SbcCD nuclease subunit